MQDELGPRGFNVLAITHEGRDQVLKLLAQAPPGPMTFTIGLGGGGSYPNLAGTVPYCWLVGADGKVVWQGNTGGLSEKVIEEEVKKSRVTPETKAARADKALAYAESLIGEKQIVRGLRVLEGIAKNSKGSEAAKKAEERKASLEKDESLKGELAAQRDLDRIAGGLELPKDKLKGKERDAKAVQIEAFIKKNKESAPVAAELAAMWVKVMQEDWAKTAK